MRFFCLLLLVFSFSILSGQDMEPKRIGGEVLVQLQPAVHLSKWLGQQNQGRAPELAFTFQRTLSSRLNIHLLTFPENGFDWEQVQRRLLRDPEVRLWQANYEVSFRNTPNDTEYFRQWDMDIIDAPLAWQSSTGGTTAKGTPIVVAVLDSGFDPNHEDLRDNLWTNPHEIAGDGVDNDNNGYVDDIIGWDFFSDSPNIAPGNHGLSTSAIVGAKGNNGIGVTGVNWDIELMLFSFNTVADAVAAYEYVVDQRSRFNSSGGTDGAFVVATNNSFGQTGVRCSQQPVWGAMYDEMGAVGVLSSAGVTNQSFDVDEIGDMPADCTSDYLLISCNTDEDDNLYQSSAYGAVAVDIGSPGEGSVTAKAGNSYGFFGGNSAATPHVTGAIALLYASSCEGLEEAAISKPAETALFVREMIMQSGDQVAALQNRTATGRRLNIGQAMQDIEASCQNILGPLALASVYPNPADESITVSYSSPVNGVYQVELYDVLGRLVQRQEEVVAEFGLRRFTVDVSHLPAGSYLLRFGQGNDWVSEKVLVF